MDITESFDIFYFFDKKTILLIILFVLNSQRFFYFEANGKTVDATQELLATSLCNIGNSFFHAYPGGGSFSRSAVTSASGVRTPLEGLYAGENNMFSKIHRIFLMIDEAIVVRLSIK